MEPPNNMIELFRHRKEGCLVVRKLLMILLAGFLVTSVVACDDAPGEDEIGDGEVQDEE
jgi:hypothetical protein